MAKRANRSERERTLGPDIVPLSRASGSATTRQVLTVPGADVALLDLDLPKAVRGQDREDVAKRQLRDKFGMDPEQLDIRPFHTARTPEQWTRVLVIDKHLLEGWRNESTARAVAVLPDYLALPTAENIWTIASGEAYGAGVFAARLGPDDGFSASDKLAPAMLEQALSGQTAKPEAILRIGQAQPELEHVADRHGIPIATDPDALNARVLEHGETAFDLRRDPQLARARLSARILPWRWPVVFGLSAAAIWAAAQVVVTHRIENETKALQRQTMIQVQEGIVGNAPVLDVRAQVSQALVAARAQTLITNADADPIELFAKAAVALDAVDATTQLARYSESDGLRLVARVDDFAGVERLVARLAEEGLSVELLETSASSSGDGVSTSLAVSPQTEPQPEGGN